MIKATELRIGNYFLDDDGVLARLNGFAPFDTSTRCDESEGCYLLVELQGANALFSDGFQTESNKSSGVSLTEGWLLDFGFKLEEVTMSGVKYYGWTKFSFLVDINKVRGSYFYNWMGGNIELKYVHQLQNLHFALTGSELTLPLLDNKQQ